MATYIGKVTIEVGVSVTATSQQEADVMAMERTYGRIVDNLDERVHQRSYNKTVELRLLET